MRTHYLNGDEISLSCGCDSCNPSRINGILCHEVGCPDAWRDTLAECSECGCDFWRDSADQRVCPDCANPEPTDNDDDSDECEHTPAPRIVPPIGSPLPTCSKCGIVYMPDDDDE